MSLDTHLDTKALEELEKQYDSALNTRDNGPKLTGFIYWASIAFALYHLWTAGFGTPVDHGGGRALPGLQPGGSKLLAKTIQAPSLPSATPQMRPRPHPPWQGPPSSARPPPGQGGTGSH